MKRFSGPVFLFVLAAVLFAGGLYHLFTRRFSSGWDYPKYSSQRTAPDGTKALYESLRALPGWMVSRNYLPLGLARLQDNATLMMAGVDPGRPGILNGSDAEVLRDYLASGGRVVICLRRGAPPKRKKVSEKAEDGSKHTAKKERAPGRRTIAGKKKKAADDKEKNVPPLRLSEMTGFRLAYFTSGKAGPVSRRARLEDSSLKGTLPEALPWRAATYFHHLAASWKVIYEVEGRAVMIRRRFGAGTLLVSGDSEFLTNRALVRERQVNLLAFLAGRRRRVVFDETHLGLTEHEGVAGLLRSYGLTGTLFSLVLLALLFLWKNVPSFVPRQADGFNGRKDGRMEGRDAASGLEALLRRTIGKHSLVEACYEEWRRTRRLPSHLSQDKAERIERMFKAWKQAGSRDRNPAAFYREISRIVKERG